MKNKLWDKMSHMTQRILRQILVKNMVNEMKEYAKSFEEFEKNKKFEKKSSDDNLSHNAQKKYLSFIK